MKRKSIQISLGEIADEIGGTLLGSSELTITGVAFVDEAEPSELAFASEKQILKKLELDYFCKAGAVIVPKHYNGTRTNIIKVDTPELAFAKAISLFYSEEIADSGISPRADIHESARIGEGVSVASSAYIGARAVINDRVVIQAGVFIGDDVVIGNDTILSNNVTILSRTHIGNRVVIQPGSLIGGDGFGYIEDGADLFKIPHIGHVVIEDDVCIGAYNTIERANLGQTLIKQGAKTGNLVYIAHNVVIGSNTRVGGHAGIAGNTLIGNHVLIGPQAGIDQELVIGNNAMIGPKAAIIANLADGESAYGTPGMSRRSWLRSASLIPQLSEMQREIKKMARKIDELEKQASAFPPLQS